MSEHELPPIPTGAIGVFFVLLGLVLGGVFGWRLTTDHWRREAVKAKAAEWVIVGEEGETEFRWRKP